MTKSKYIEVLVQLRDALKKSQKLKVNELTKELLDKPLVEVVARNSQDSIDEIVQLSGISQESVDSIRSLEGEDNSIDSLVLTSTSFDSEEF